MWAVRLCLHSPFPHALDTCTLWFLAIPFANIYGMFTSRFETAVFQSVLIWKNFAAKSAGLLSELRLAHFMFRPSTDIVLHRSGITTALSTPRPESLLWIFIYLYDDVITLVRLFVSCLKEVILLSDAKLSRVCWHRHLQRLHWRSKHAHQIEATVLLQPGRVLPYHSGRADSRIPLIWPEHMKHFTVSELYSLSVQTPGCPATLDVPKTAGVSFSFDLLSFSSSSFF